MAALLTGRDRLRAGLALLIVTGFLAALLWSNESARRSGAEIVLETQPVDPRDVFFGHYAILRYTIAGDRPGLDRLDDGLSAAFNARLAEHADGEDAPSRPWSLDGGPAFAVLEEGDPFYTVQRYVGDLESARRSGAPFLAATWRAERTGRCNPDAAPCWTPVFSFDLPGAYYADRTTALAMQRRQRERAEFRRDMRAFEKCEASRAAASAEEPPPENCAAFTSPPTPARDFGVILSVSDRGHAVVKGLYNDGDRVLDSLAGPRIVTSDVE